MSIEGVIARQKVDRVETEFIPMHHDFYELHEFLTLPVDVMCINGMVFLTTLLRKIKLFTVEHISSHTAK